MPAKKSAAKGAVRKSPRGARASAETPRSMPKEGKDPEGGLTAKGREYFAKTEGAHLRPGVQGKADTPEKMVRKGSFLRRHFAHPRGPVKDEKGEPTRLALSAHAWGEPVPQTMADTKKLAAKGHELLEEYHRAKDGAAGAKTSPGKKGVAKKGRCQKGCDEEEGGGMSVEKGSKVCFCGRTGPGRISRFFAGLRMTASGVETTALE